MRHVRAVLIPALLIALASPAAADDIRVSTVDGLRRTVNAARPGDRVLLAAGDYRGNFYFTNVHGTAARPIVIAAANPTRPPRFIGDTICLQISGASHLELRDLVLTGSKSNALNIDDRENPVKPSHHITLRNLRVTDVGPRGNVDGIKLSGINDLVVADCTVERWGSGGSAIDMVGCHQAVLSGCVFRKGGANAVQAKGGSTGVTLRLCRFEDCGERAVNAGGSTDDASFRPPLKTFPPNGKYEVKDVRIEGCTFVGSSAPVACVGADGVVMRYNTIVRPARYVLRILQERAEPGFIPCRNGVFERNVIVFRADCGGINVGPGTAADTFRFAGNFWYCEDRPEQGAPVLPTPDKDRIEGKDPAFRNPAKGDYTVRPGSPAADRGAHALPGP